MLVNYQFVPTFARCNAMAVCFTCNNPMSQTEAICPSCGEDFLEPTPSRWDIFFAQSSLTDLFRKTAVMAFCFATLPTVTGMGFAWPFGLGIACGISVLLLGETSPLWSRIMSLIGLTGFFFYPLLGISMAAMSFIRWLHFMLSI